MKQIKVGLIGAAGRLAALAHANGYLANPNARIVAICDVDKAVLQARAKEWEVPRVYTDYRELLSDRDVELVDVLTPPYLHAPMAVAAAQAGKHVIVEKPMCRSLAEADEMIDAARKSGVRLMVAESYAFTTPHVKARELIDQGAIGEPIHVRQTKGAWRLRTDVPERSRDVEATLRWRWDPVQSGGGDFPWFMDHAVHFFATARYLMQDADVVKVYAMPHQRRTSDGGTVKDVAAVTWEYAGGHRYGVWTRADESLQAFDYLGFRTEVYGAEGVIEVLGEGGGLGASGVRPAPLTLHTKGKTTRFQFDEGLDWRWDSVVNYYDRAHRNEIDHFIQCLVEDKEPRYTGERGRKDIQCTLAAIMSATQDRPAEVASVPLGWTAYATEA
ncbi:MAG: Gfo/Idh/MocA family oxidoreductase [Chloroflexota bacterium]|nr:Gfo/Idh/MocA family oxidoreductase [Chloroflexota bacterium]